MIIVYYQETSEVCLATIFLDHYKGFIFFKNAESSHGKTKQTQFVLFCSVLIGAGFVCVFSSIHVRLSSDNLHVVDGYGDGNLMIIAAAN